MQPAAAGSPPDRRLHAGRRMECRASRQRVPPRHFPDPPPQRRSARGAGVCAQYSQRSYRRREAHVGSDRKACVTSSHRLHSAGRRRSPWMARSARRAGVPGSNPPASPKLIRPEQPCSASVFAAASAPRGVPPPIATGQPRRRAMRASVTRPTTIAGCGGAFNVYHVPRHGVAGIHRSRHIGHVGFS